jgi:hypothetical protein
VKFPKLNPRPRSRVSREVVVRVVPRANLPARERRLVRRRLHAVRVTLVLRSLRVLLVDPVRQQVAPDDPDPRRVHLDGRNSPDCVLMMFGTSIS